MSDKEYLIHTILLANRDNEGHEATRLHAALEMALAGLGVPDTAVVITPCRVVMRNPSGLVRLNATRYEIIDRAKLVVGRRNPGYAGGYPLDAAVREIVSGTDILWRVVHSNA